MPYSIPGISEEARYKISIPSIEARINITVCKYFNAKPESLSTKCKSPKIAEPRMIIVLLYVVMLKMSQTGAAAKFRMRAALYCHSKTYINNLYKTDKSYRKKIDGIFAELATDRKQLRHLYLNLLTIDITCEKQGTI